MSESSILASTETRIRCCRTSTGSRMQQWDENEEKGFYLRHILHAYFIWNPRTHHEMADRQEGKKRNWFSLSADKCIQRERREHEDLLSEFSSSDGGRRADPCRDGNAHSTDDATTRCLSRPSAV